MPKIHLKFKGITSRTAAIYKREIVRFLDWAQAELGRLPNQVEELDECMGEFINCLYQDGEAVSHAGWLLSGFKRFLPAIRRDLVTAQQFYNNWIRDHVPQRAVPMPWGVAQTLAALACHEGHYDLAFMVLVGFTFFLRTMELVQLAVQDAHVQPSAHSVILTLEQSKTSRRAAQSLVVQNSTVCRMVSQSSDHYVNNTSGETTSAWFDRRRRIPHPQGGLEGSNWSANVRESLRCPQEPQSKDHDKRRSQQLLQAKAPRDFAFFFSSTERDPAPNASAAGPFGTNAGV
eukprot:s1749_g7.t1